LVLIVVASENNGKSAQAASSSQNVKAVQLYLFHMESCPHCREEQIFLEKIKKKYPYLEIKEFEVSQGMKGRSIFRKVTEAFHLSGAVPVTIIGDQPIIGFDDGNGIGKDIEKKIEECSHEKCVSPKTEAVLALFSESSKGSFPSETVKETKKTNKNTNEDDSHKKIRIFGKEICLKEQSSVCMLGAVLGLADGINPCMFSVLIFLLTYLLAIGSRRRALKAGIAFIITTFVVYLLFMYGLVKIIDVLEIAAIARQIVAGFALVAGLIMVKDFFFYGKGISLEIPKQMKPKIEQLVKKGTLPSAVLLALLSSIVELPCTSGLPLAYISILTGRGIFSLDYLLLYNFFFIIPLAVIVIGVVFTWAKVEQVEGWRLKYRKYMRAVAGVLLLLLALALWKNWL